MRQMHHRIPAWKLKLCVEALHASPVHLVRIAEVTEIQFASPELIDVAVQCPNEIAEESKSADVSADTSGVTAAATRCEDKESANDKSASPESEKESKSMTKESADKNEPCRESTGQGAPASARLNLLRLLLRHHKMPQHHIMNQSPRRGASQQRIRLRIGSPSL